MMLRTILIVLLLGFGQSLVWAQESTGSEPRYGNSASVAGVRIKELARLSGAKENALVGYGLVTGLAGTGDSSRSGATTQSIRNMLLRFGVNVPADTVRSRNTAGVMITATLPPYAQPGDKLDANITSLGDARSLLGGTLLLTHLMGSNNEVYALAQGPISVGGFSFDLNGNLVQKNHPTAATLAGGATVERSTRSPMINESGNIQYVLYDPDLATAKRIADSINQTLGGQYAHALDAARVRIERPGRSRDALVSDLTAIEEARVVPDNPARVVINERTGTVVSGGNVRISPVTITHGDLNVTISTEFIVSQPSFVFRTGPGVRSVVVPDTEIEVEEEELVGVNLPNSSTVAELVTALNQVKATSRDMITILQSIRTAGALHAELIVQ